MSQGTPLLQHHPIGYKTPYTIPYPTHYCTLHSILPNTLPNTLQNTLLIHFPAPYPIPLQTPKYPIFLGSVFLVMRCVRFESPLTGNSFYKLCLGSTIYFRLQCDQTRPHINFSDIDTPTQMYSSCKGVRPHTALYSIVHGYRESRPDARACGQPGRCTEGPAGDESETRDALPSQRRQAGANELPRQRQGGLFI